MPTVCQRYLLSAAALLLLCGIDASTITTAPQPSKVPTIAPTCEFRTINYITDTLPQLCLISSWSNAHGTPATSVQSGEAAGDVGASTKASAVEVGSIVPIAATTGESASAGQTSTFSGSPTSSEAAEASATDLEAGELNDASFLSFEEWKKQTLEKAGQADSNIGRKRNLDGKKRDSSSFQNHLDSLGEEGEIDIDIGFGSGGRDGRRPDGSHILEAGESEMEEDKAEVTDRKDRDHYRSKDAGKTCKERFSYASFDAGATILKTHPGAKNSKAVLIENKDSYMLSECSAENKFIIVELSEDIWIDTIVLANYEFFSSMIRTFRVSVSERYPVKIDKWKDIGTYEARNSRDIQAFLVENPQIWARYFRIEFLSHYGNEYYCPLSLLRVHGTRMLESWKESEANAEDEENDDSEGGNEEQFVHDAVAETVKEEERLSAEHREAEAHATQVAVPDSTGAAGVDSLKSIEIPDESPTTSPWEYHEPSRLFDLTIANQREIICLPREVPVQQAVQQIVIVGENASIPSSIQGSSSNVGAENSNIIATPTTSTITQQAEKPTTIDIPTIRDSSTVVPGSDKFTSRSDAPTSTTGTTIKAPNGTNSVKSKASSTSTASSSLPTIQESFFKAVSRRLNFLESNSTLSLKYIEDQSRILREAFTRVEKKQLQKTTIFLETLNSTVLDELRGFRQQYDEIWQSTVISLESQREASRKEFLAISSRLNILADEVVFQKRMSIVQSVLLLLCLGLVIFSRVSGGGNLDISYLPNRMKSFPGYPIESPIESPLNSPAYQRTHMLRDGRWLEANHKRKRSDETIISHSRSRENSPPTPTSTYSRSDEILPTPPSVTNGTIGDRTTNRLIFSSSPNVRPSPSKISSYHSVPSPSSSSLAHEPESPLAALARSPERRKPFSRESFDSSSNDSEEWPLKSDLSPPSSDLRPRLSSQHLHPQLARGQQYEHGDEYQDHIEHDGEQEDDVGTQPGPKSAPAIHLPSPPLDDDRERRSSGGWGFMPSFSIVRKPLPALPIDRT